VKWALGDINFSVPMTASHLLGFFLHPGSLDVKCNGEYDLWCSG
jgi:hypothetical protein